MPQIVPKVEKTKYYICVREIGGSIKRFKDCDYHYHPEKKHSKYNNFSKPKNPVCW